MDHSPYIIYNPVSPVRGEFVVWSGVYSGSIPHYTGLTPSYTVHSNTTEIHLSPTGDLVVSHRVPIVDDAVVVGRELRRVMCDSTLTRDTVSRLPIRDLRSLMTPSSTSSDYVRLASKSGALANVEVDPGPGRVWEDVVGWAGDAVLIRSHSGPGGYGKMSWVGGRRPARSPA